MAEQSFEAFLDQVRPATELIAEVQEELADVCGWSAILWSRLQRLRDAAARIDHEDPRAQLAARLNQTRERLEQTEHLVEPDRLPLVGAERQHALRILGGVRE